MSLHSALGYVATCEKNTTSKCRASASVKLCEGIPKMAWNEHVCAH